MLREAKIQRILGDACVAVPKILAVCEDESLLGVPFYVMEYLDGHIVTDTLPASLESAESRLRLAELVVETLAALHGIDVTTGAGVHARASGRLPAAAGLPVRRPLADLHDP
jgi:aminoglycoside phosphotransferase (APT) family kinase protein